MYRLGVDVGGTFTDVLLFNEQTSEIVRTKVPTTPEDQSIGVLNGVTEVLGSTNAHATDIRQFLHGSTVATNAMIERKGARVGLLVTRGYRQVIHIGRSFVPGGLGGWIVWDRPATLVSLEDVKEISGRIDAQGKEIEALDDQSVRTAVRELVDRGVDAISIMLMNSYVNDTHEKRTAAIASEVAKGIPVSVSAQILPEMGEYDRAITTVANAYVRPTVERYLHNLSDQLARLGMNGEQRVLRSDGGLTSFDIASELPVNLLMSGPAGGVAAASAIGPAVNFNEMLTLDMGGTSTDVALIENGLAIIRRETTVEDLTVRAPSIDIATVGAGGGSIAQVTEWTGALRVGPESAGANPGPAAYGRGGTAATVTDANVVLGYLPHSLLGGRMKLDIEASRAAVGELATAMGVSIENAASAVIDIVNENMLGALRLISVQRGYDPRDFGLFVFGGAGPLHGNALANLLGSWPVVIPPSPGVLCAFGDASTGLRAEHSRSVVRQLHEVSLSEFQTSFDELATLVNEELSQAGAPQQNRSLRHEVDVRYQGQGFDVSVEVDLVTNQAEIANVIRHEFDEAHRRLFGFALEDDLEIMALRVIGMSEASHIVPVQLENAGPDPSAAAVGTQQVFVDGVWHNATLYDRSSLLAGNRILGPAIVIEMDSTTLVQPGCAATVDAIGNLIITLDAMSERSAR